MPGFSDLFEFILAEWLLVAAWLWLIFALLWLNRMRSGERISSIQLVRMINRGPPVIVDLRPSHEFSAGHIKGAVNIPATKIAKSLHQLEKHREEPLVLVCSLGQAAPGVARTLGEAGYNRVHCLVRGVLGWSDDNLPLVKKN
ncbi:MAG: rhodanese-like domain-containing protein [Gammaproteobacteria bacterium AqS3]|nr:rhodanese-like domain-containing protein [Gammaproteobacteria bacterium AqS3]